MFLDKDNHLAKLNELYGQNCFQSASLYCDAGMGKTTLLRQFSAGKRTLYFKPLETTDRENFLALKEEAIRVLGALEKLKAAKRFAELFRTIGRSAKEEPLLFIIDDFPHLINKNRRLSTLIQSYMTKEWKTSKLFVILCKPASLYEKESTQAANPLLLKPLTFFETRQLFRHLPIEQQICIFGITGGVPGYLAYFVNGRPFQENLYQLFFTEEGAFYRRPTKFLKVHLSEPELAHSALLCLGAKRRKLHEICERTELTPSAAGSLMNTLDLLGLVDKIIPVTEDAGSRRTLYRIADGVFRFWYTFAAPHRSAIELGCGRDVFEKEILPALDSYSKETFEDICRQYLDLLACLGEAPFPYDHAGSWWGQHPTRKRTEYVPIAASDDSNMLLGDCFWTDQWIDLEGLQGLQKHAGLFPHSTIWYCLFAKSDFVSGMETIFGDTVKVFTLEQMCTRADAVVCTPDIC